MTLRVAAPGLLTTVQDLGRYGHQRDGVPVGGAMDALALRLANALVGNPEGAAGLEVTLAGPVLEFADGALIAIGGADLGASVDGCALPPWHAAWIPRGATLRFGEPRTGCRAYLTVAGGLAVPPVLGSRSTFVRARLGGLQGRALAAGDRLDRGAPGALSRRIEVAIRATGAEPALSPWRPATPLLPEYSTRAVVRLLPGAHLEAITAESRELLFGAEFRVTPDADRTGYRLGGPALSLSAPVEPLSEAVTFGTLQLPPGGQLILLMADRQTTGGYPRLGEVATVDLPVLAQLRPGDRLRFTPGSLAEAQSLYLARERDISLLRAHLTHLHRAG